MEEQGRKRKNYLDYLRVTMLFFVIMVHLTAQGWWQTDQRDYKWYVYDVYDGIVRIGVPVFVMISGTLFLSRDITIKRLYSKYIRRIVVSFLVWNAFYQILPCVHFDNGIRIDCNWVNVIRGEDHLWFLYMILGLYVAQPFFRRIAADRHILKYFLIASFIYSFLIPAIINCIRTVCSSDEMIQSLLDAVNYAIFTRINLSITLGYALYFMLGYYFDNIELSKWQRIIIYIFGIVGVFCTISFRISDKSCLAFIIVSSLSLDLYAVFQVLAIFTWYKYRRYNNEKLNVFANKLSNYCMGGYLIHIFIQRKILKYTLDVLLMNPIVMLPVLGIVILTVSLAVSCVLNHIPFVKKYCV